MRKWLNAKYFLIISVLFFSCSVMAAEEFELDNTIYLDKTKLVSQQINLLKTRLAQSQNEMANFQRQQEATEKEGFSREVTKQSLSQIELDISVAKSNLDSINIELSESQQTINRLDKDTQEIENQLNVYNMFGVKAARNGIPDLNVLYQELNYQKKLLQLEKKRADYLQQLQKLSLSALQFHKTKLARVDSLLKSQTMMQLKEQQAKSEIGFQQQQSFWLEQLNALYSQLNQTKQNSNSEKAEYVRLENQIFYANENVNFTYLKMLISRYQDQIQQLKVSISRSSSITLLNKVSEQAQLLGKQLGRVDDLLHTRLTILEKRKKFLLQMPETKSEQTGLIDLSKQYNAAVVTVVNLNQQLATFRVTLEQALKQELSARQGLPTFGAKAWLDLGAEILLVPSLAFQVLKSLIFGFFKAFYNMSYLHGSILAALEVGWIGLFVMLGHFFKKIMSGMRDHEYGHINLNWLSIKLLHRSLIDIAFMGNLIWLFIFCRIPAQHFGFLMDLAIVWLVFKLLTAIARLSLVETVHDQAGHDVRLYHRLKWTFLTGGIITALTVFIHQLPLIYEVKDLFARIFLLFLLIVSIFLLRSWEVLPGLILPHVDRKHTYLRRVLRSLAFIIPVVLLINSAIGLFGYVNFVLTVSWYESVFLCVLVGYLICRGVLNEIMEYVSKLVIRHTLNGWLWTEAFLKPLDTVLRVALFLVAWTVLFLLYGWDAQSSVVVRFATLLNYRLIDVLNTSITPLSIIELCVILSFLYWAAKWTREFVYRFLLSRTKDLGIRNSIAILSQYSMILIAAFVCLRVLGIDFKALAFVASMLAFGIGLGLRDLANNFVCGFLLLLERPLRVGDIVSVNDYEGEVTHIGGRAVTIRTWDHMDVLVPNAEIFSKSFTNWTAKDNVVRTVITIKINRHDKPHEIQSIIHQVLATHKDVLSEPASEVFLKELAEGLVEFEIRYFIDLRQVKSRLGVRSEVLVAIWEAFEANDIQAPYPHHEVHVKANGQVFVPSFVKAGE